MPPTLSPSDVHSARVDKPGNTIDREGFFGIEELMVEIDELLAEGDDIEELSELIDVADFSA